MKILFSIFSIFIFSNVFAFTLTNQQFVRFDNKKDILVHVAQDGCSASGGYTAQELLDMAMNGAELYWNTVETANIRLARGQILGVNANGLDTTQFYSEVFSYRNQIVIGCSSAVSSTAAAVATSRGSDRNIVGVVLFRDATANFGRPYDTTSAILAHEIGHTLGLGHTTFAHALMQGSGGSLGLYKLTQDDRDGLTYLYPHDKEVGGCLGSLGTIYDVNNDDDFMNGPLNFIIGLILILFVMRRPFWRFKLSQLR